VKNKDNIQSPEKFNPPTEHEAFMDGKLVGTCFVYDGPAWRNRNRSSIVNKPKKQAKPDPVRKQFATPKPGWA
jgi:hypothetical protein